MQFRSVIATSETLSDSHQSIKSRAFSLSSLLTLTLHAATFSSHRRSAAPRIAVPRIHLSSNRNPRFHSSVREANSSNLHLSSRFGLLREQTLLHLRHHPTTTATITLHSRHRRDSQEDPTYLHLFAYNMLCYSLLSAPTTRTSPLQPF